MSTCKPAAASPLDNFKLVGEAKLEILFWDIYHSRLYSRDGEYLANRYPLALEIEYLRDISAEDLVKRSVKEWKKIGIPATTYQPWLTPMAELWPEIKRGDTLLLVVDNQQRNQFYFNNQLLGGIADHNFGATFLAIWLDDNASFPKLRRKLTGKQP